MSFAIAAISFASALHLRQVEAGLPPAVEGTEKALPAAAATEEPSGAGESAGNAPVQLASELLLARCARGLASGFMVGGFVAWLRAKAKPKAKGKAKGKKNQNPAAIYDVRKAKASHMDQPFPIVDRTETINRTEKDLMLAEAALTVIC